MAVPDQPNKSFSGNVDVDKDRIIDGFFEVGQSGFGPSIRDTSGKQAFKRMHSAIQDETQS